MRHGRRYLGIFRRLGIALNRVSDEIGRAGTLGSVHREHDLPRGVKLAYILLAASFWLVSLALLVYLAHRISRPIQQLTRGWRSWPRAT